MTLTGASTRASADRGGHDRGRGKEASGPASQAVTLKVAEETAEQQSWRIAELEIELAQARGRKAN
jgi:hypothetical protein